jgi:nucleotide-binding universal stress UspA family protein
VYQRILVAIGESPWSEAAVAYAIALAQCTNAELCLLTVLNMPASHTTSDKMQFFDLVMDVVKREGELRLRHAMDMATRAEVAHTPVCRWDTHISQAILQTATEEKCGLIVLGSAPITGGKRLRLSRVAQAVAANARQPTLVIKPPLFAQAVALPWQRVLVAVDNTPWSEAAIAHAVSLAHAQRGRVCFLHVDRARRQRGNDPAASAGKHLLTLAAAYAAAAGVMYETRLARGDRVEEILRTARQAQCEAIILGVGSRPASLRRPRSPSFAVVTATRLPILIVKH